MKNVVSTSADLIYAVLNLTMLDAGKHRQILTPFSDWFRMKSRQRDKIDVLRLHPHHKRNPSAMSST